MNTYGLAAVLVSFGVVLDRLAPFWAGLLCVGVLVYALCVTALRMLWNHKRSNA